MPTITHFCKRTVIHHNTFKVISWARWVPLVHAFMMFQLKDARINSSVYSQVTVLIKFMVWLLIAHCFSPLSLSFHLHLSFPPFVYPPPMSSFLSRPGPAAPSRSCCLQRGSNSPTPQSSTPLSSPTPWAARSLSPTGGERHCSLHCTCPRCLCLRFSEPTFLLHRIIGWINKSDWLTYFIFEASRIKALCEMKFSHITSGAGLYYSWDKLISKASGGFIGQNVL